MTSQEPSKKVKLLSLKADLELEKKGAWIPFPDWPGVEFKVSAFTNPEYEAARAAVFQRLSQAWKKNSIPRNVMSKELGKLYAKHILHDWRGLDEEYSEELAYTTLTDPAYRMIVSAVEYCATKASEVEFQFAEDEEGNSSPPSDTDFSESDPAPMQDGSPS